MKIPYHWGLRRVEDLANNTNEPTEALEGQLAPIIEQPLHCRGDQRFMENFSVEKFSDEDDVSQSTSSSFLFRRIIVQAGVHIKSFFHLILTALNEECAKIEDVIWLACFLHFNLWKIKENWKTRYYKIKGEYIF